MSEARFCHKDLSDIQVMISRRWFFTATIYIIYIYMIYSCLTNNGLKMLI